MSISSEPWIVPDAWSWVAIGEVASVVGGGTPRTAEESNFAGGTIPWVTPADLSGYAEKYIGRGSRNITTTGLNGSGARLLPKGTVLFSSRAPIGYVAIASNALATNQGFKSFVLPRGLEPEYVYYYLQRAKELVLDLASGTTFQEVSGRQAAKIPLAIAPYGEQHRIVSAIESYFTRLDDAVATLERVQRNLKRYRASVLKAAVEGRLVPSEAELARARRVEAASRRFVELSSAPEIPSVPPETRRDAASTYEPASVLLTRILAERRRRCEEAELAKMTAKGKPPKDDKWKAKYVEPVAPDTSALPALPEGWCWASPGQFFSWASGDFLPKKAQRGGAVPVIGGNGVNGFHDEALALTPTIVVGRVGAHCGNIHLTDGPVWITDNAIYAAEGCDLSVLPYWRMVMSIQNLNADAGGTGQPYVNQKHLNDLAIPLAPEAEQRRIVQEVERLDSLLARVHGDARSSKARLTRLRQSILKWAFEGRLVDQDPTDEPASVLLERIRAERVSTDRARPTPRGRRGAQAPDRHATAREEPG